MPSCITSGADVEFGGSGVTVMSGEARLTTDRNTFVASRGPSTCLLSLSHAYPAHVLLSPLKPTLHMSYFLVTRVPCTCPLPYSQGYPAHGFFPSHKGTCHMSSSCSSSDPQILCPHVYTWALLSWSHLSHKGITCTW